MPQADILVSTVGCQVPPVARQHIRSQDGFIPRQNARYSASPEEQKLTDLVLAAPQAHKAFLECERLYAVAKGVKLQEALGVDIISEGELSRQYYSIYFLAEMEGVEVSGDRAALLSLPHLRRHAIAEDFALAAQFTSKPIKLTIPGPFTLAHRVENQSGLPIERLAEGFAGAVRLEVAAAFARGCRHIQIDEPLFTSYPDKARAFGLALLGRCTEGFTGLTRYVHVCRNYPLSIDGDASNKASSESYRHLADALGTADVDVISVEDASQPNQFDVLERLSAKRLMLGLCSIGTRQIEATDQIVLRAKDIISRTGRADLILAPDCGFLYLDYDTASRKMAALSAARDRLRDLFMN